MTQNLFLGKSNIAEINHTNVSTKVKTRNITKKFLISFLLLMNFKSYANIPTDKFSHAYVGLGIYAGCFLFKGVGESLNFNMDYLNAQTCLIPVVAAGIGKELYDYQHPETHTAELLDAVSTIAIPSLIGFSYKF